MKKNHPELDYQALPEHKLFKGMIEQDWVWEIPALKKYEKAGKGKKRKKIQSPFVINPVKKTNLIEIAHGTLRSKRAEKARDEQATSQDDL